MELEKKQAEREKSGLEFQLKDVTQKNTQLQNTVSDLNKRIAQLESQLQASDLQLNHVLNSQGMNSTCSLLMH